MSYTFEDLRLDRIEIDMDRIRAFMKLIDIYDPYFATCSYLAPHLNIEIVHTDSGHLNSGYSLIFSINLLSKDGTFYDHYAKDIEDKLREFKLSIITGQWVLSYFA